MVVITCSMCSRVLARLFSQYRQSHFAGFERVHLAAAMHWQGWAFGSVLLHAQFVVTCSVDVSGVLFQPSTYYFGV